MASPDEFSENLGQIIHFLDLLGTCVFAISGGQKAARKNLDYLGVFVLALMTGVGGGVVRDVLLGCSPPTAFQEEIYLVCCFVGAVLVIVCIKDVLRRWNRVLIADAIGLGIFAVIGTTKALDYGLGPIGSVMMGALTAAGGGAIRDICAGEIPEVLKGDFYASVALIGGTLIVLGRKFGFESSYWICFVIVLTIVLRLWAMGSKIELSKIKMPDHAT